MFILEHGAVTNRRNKLKHVEGKTKLRLSIFLKNIFCLDSILDAQILKCHTVN